MQKLSFQKHPIHNLFTTMLLLGGLFAAAGLTSCDNFLNGGDVKQEIEDAIAYNNAKEITVLIQPEEGTGTTVPAGKYTVKQGYNYEVSFTESAAYSFKKWIAVSKENPSKIITDGVSFTDETSPKTKFKITNDTTDIRLIPQCIERIAVAREPSPGYSSTGVSRNSPIHVDFTKALNPASFIFKESEIPSGAEVKKDDKGNIWAYTIEDETFFKNVKITDNNGFSIAGYFTKPEVSGANLTIQTDALNPLPFITGETVKTIVVTLSKEITDSSNVTMSAEKSWRYLVNDSTTEKASISFVNNIAEGSITSASRDYSIGQTLKLSFIENANYQFIRWIYDSEILLIEEPDSPETTALVLKKTEGSEPMQVRALCAERLAITDYSPKTTEAVCKNSSIWIKFNHNITQADADKIVIAIGGTPVKSSFITPPLLSGNTVTFKADKTNLIDVPAGKTKTISVSVPDDLSYEYDDNGSAVKVFYGGNGAAFDYKIKDETEEKAFVEITATTNSGTVEPSGAKDYSFDSEVPLSFVPASDYHFNGWKITDADGNEIPETIVKIADKKSLETKLYVYQELGADSSRIKVKADASKKLTVNCSPSSGVQPKDTPIVLTFNQLLPAALDISKIKVTLDGANVTSYFEPEKSGKKITLTNTKILNVTGNEKKTVTVIVPDTIYYQDGENQIYLENEQTFDYEVKSETTSKTTVTFSAKDGSGTINQGVSKAYNIGESVDLKFALTDGWQFNGWEVKSKGADVSEEKIYIEDREALNTKLHIYEQVSDVTITAKANLLPAVLSYTPAVNETVYVSTPIQINFSMPMEAASVSAEDSLFKYEADKISITANGISLADKFNTPVFDAEKKVLTITPKTTELKQYMDNQRMSYMEIRVSFGEGLGLKDGNLFLPFAKTSVTAFGVLYTAADITPPEAKELFVTAQNITLNSSLQNLSEMKLKLVEDSLDNVSAADLLTADEYADNLVNRFVYFRGTYADSLSGVKSIIVYEKTTNDVNGNIKPKTSNSYFENTIEYDLDSEEVEFTRDNKGNTSFCIKHILNKEAESIDGGAVLLKMAVKDCAGNISEYIKPFSVIVCKDLNFEADLYNTITKEAEKYTNGIVNRATLGWYHNDITVDSQCEWLILDNHKTDIKTLIIDDYKNYKKDFAGANELYNAAIPYKDIGLKSNLVDYYCEYSDKNGITRFDKFPDFDEIKKCRKLTLNVDSVNDLSFKLICKYNDILVCEKKYTFPSSAYFVKTSYQYNIDSASGTALSIEKVIKNNKECFKFKSYGELGSYHIDISETRNGEEWYILPFNGVVGSGYYGEGLFGDLLGPIDFSDDSEVQIPAVECVEVKKSATNGYLDLKYQIEGNWWEHCDSLTIDSHGIPKGSNSIVIQYPTTNAYTDYYNSKANKDLTNTQIYVNAIGKNGKISSKRYLILNQPRFSYQAEYLLTGSVIIKSYSTSDETNEQNVIKYDNVLPGLYNKQSFDFHSPQTEVGWNVADSYDDKAINMFFRDYESGPLKGTVTVNSHSFNFSDDMENPAFFMFTASVPWNTLRNGNNSLVWNLEDRANNKRTIERVMEAKLYPKLFDKTFEVAQEVKEKKAFGSDAYLYYQINSDGQWNWKGSEVGDGFLGERFVLEETLPNDFPQNYKGFIKFGIVSIGGNAGSPFAWSSDYYYYGTYSGTGEYNILMPNGTSKDSVVVCSDSDVLVHVYAVKDDYDVCKNWSAHEWTNYGKMKKEVMLKFSSSEHNMKRFNIPLDTFDEDDVNYCVVVHFADNTELASEVMHR